MVWVLYAGLKACQAYVKKKRPGKEMKKAPISGLLSVGGIGLEPTTSAMSKQCSNQLSYPPGSEGIL